MWKSRFLTHSEELESPASLRDIFESKITIFLPDDDHSPHPSPRITPSSPQDQVPILPTLPITKATLGGSASIRPLARSSSDNLNMQDQTQSFEGTQAI